MNIEQNDRSNHKIKQSDHSLGPDIFTGWQSKTLIPRLLQFPLIFAQQTTDLISKTLTSFGSQSPFKVIYMGFRPSSNMKAFKQYGQNKNSKYVNQSFLYCKNKIKKFKFLHYDEPQKYFPIRPSQYRLFTGINPTWKNEDIRFSSQFQGGNLDLAILVNPSQYDLLMRVDSNTKGHTSWFFFKVFNIKKKKKVKFNLINFTKNNLLYLEGMKPYVYRTSKNIWTQDGIQVEFKSRTIRYFTQKDQPIVSKCLSFSYEFENTHEQVYFAYSIPYSYSYLLEFLQEIQKKHSQFIRINYDNQTTGGLRLPVLTITNFTKTTQKKTCLAIGRLHAGQPQGSWMIEGFIRYMCHPQAHSIRDKIEFKIIPMVNIDGVVLGNFRTGIGGRDLNRMFNNPNTFNQTRLIKDIAKQSKPEFFLDFHGHSGKKNVFIYGPQYKIQDSEYLTSRLYPKIISKKTEAFRYYACVFKISQSKINTGRALLFYEYKTRFVFTIEASTHAYSSNKQKIIFTSEKYVEVGEKIAQSLQDFVKMITRIPKRMQVKANEDIFGKQHKKSKKKVNQIEQIMLDQKLKIEDFFQDCESDLQKQLLKQIMQNQKEVSKSKYKDNSFHEEDSDCQDQNQDYTEEQLQKIQKNKEINQSSQKIKKDKSKYKVSSIKKTINLKDKLNKSNNYSTVDDAIMKNEGNKSLILSRQFVKNRQIYIDRTKAQSSFDNINSKEKNIKESKIQKFNDHYQSLKFVQNGQIEKLRKLNAWKSIQLKKYAQLQLMQMQRNKSTNSVYFQGPPSIEGEPLHANAPKIRSQMKRADPILLIKKSFLPIVMIKNNSKNRILQQQVDPQQRKYNQKSLINEILEIHERKRKKNNNQLQRKMKIMFHQNL